MTIGADAALTVGRNLLSGATAAIGGDLTTLNVLGAIRGGVFVDGAGRSFRAGSLDGAVVTTGFGLQSLRVDDDVTNSLLQAGVSRGGDGAFGTTDLNETSRMARVKAITIRGAMTDSIIASGGAIDQATVSAGMTNSSISAGLSLGGAAIRDVIDDATPLATIAEQNAARSGADRQLFRGNFGSARVNGLGLANSDLTAGVDAGADGDFDTTDPASIVASVTGGSSRFKSVRSAADGASNILADAGAVGTTVGYAIADITPTNPLETLINAAVDITPLVYGNIGGAHSVTITVKGNGQVDVHDADTAGDTLIDTLVLRGTNSRTRVTIETSTPGAVTIGRIISEDEAGLDSFTFDGDLVGDGSTDPDLWLDNGINTLVFRDLADDWDGRIGGDVKELTMRTQGSGVLRVGGRVERLTIVDGSSDPLLTALAAAPSADVGSMATDSTSLVWVFDTGTGQLSQVDLTTDPATVVTGPLDVTDAFDGSALTLTGLDFDGGDVLYAVASLYNQSPTQQVGSIADGNVSLQGLAADGAGLVVAVEDSAMVSIGDLGGEFNVVALTVTPTGQMLAVNDNAGTFELYTVMRDATGAVTAFTYVTDIVDDDPAANAVTAVSAMESDAFGTVYIVGTRPAVNAGGDQELFTLSWGNGVATLAAALDDGAAVTDTIEALAFGPSDTSLYAVRDQGGTHVLYTIDTGTGAITEVVGATLGTGEIRVDGEPASAAIIGMDRDAAGNLFAIDVGPGTGRPVRIYLTDPGLSWSLDEAGAISAAAGGVASDADGAFYTVNAAASPDTVLRTSAADRLVVIDTATGARATIGALRDIYNNTYYNDVLSAGFNQAGALLALVLDRDGVGGADTPADGVSIVRVETIDADSDGFLRVSSPTTSTQPAVRLDDGGAINVNDFPALAVDGSGQIHAIRRNLADTQDELVTIDADGSLTFVGVVQVDGGDTNVIGMGFDANGNLVAYENDGIDADLIAIDTVAPAASTRVTAAGALDAAIDEFAIGRGAGDLSTYAYDAAGAGTFYTNPGTAATLGTVDTTSGEFLQLRPLVADGTGAPLGSIVLGAAIDIAGAGDVFALAADGRLFRYDPADGSFVAAPGTIAEASSGITLNVTAIEFDDTTGELIGLDARFNRLVTISTADATAEPRMESGGADGTDLTALTYDAPADNFYSFSDSADTFVRFRGTTQDDLGGIVANSVERLTIGGGAGYNGRIVTTGNSFSNSITVTGDFGGSLISAGNIKKYTQTGGDFGGALRAGRDITSVTIRNGDFLLSGSVEAGGDLGALDLRGGDFAGMVSAETVKSIRVKTAGDARADLQIAGLADRVQFSGGYNGQASFGSVGTLALGRLEGGAVVNVYGDASMLRFSGGTAAGSSVFVDGAVRSLTTGDTHEGLISIRRGMRTARLAGLDGAIVSVGLDTNSFSVTGDTVDSVISFGTWVGDDGVYNTADDVITGGSVKSATFSGDFQDSAIVAGVLPNADSGPGIPADMREYTGNPSAASIADVDSAEAGGILKSNITRLTIRGNVINTWSSGGWLSVAAAADNIGRVSLKSKGAVLVMREYGDPFGPPTTTVGSIEVVNASDAKFVFSEEINTASFVLSQDADGDGLLTGLTDVLGSVLVTDESGAVLNDVQLAYTTQTDEAGVVRGALHVIKDSLFDGSQRITVALSGSLIDPAIYDRSGLRSALRDLDQDGIRTEAEDVSGTIFDGDEDGTEGSEFQVGIGELVLDSVPAYEWYYGCSPTSATMLMGYYDGLGYDDLIVGDASTQSANVNNAIASSGDGQYDGVGGHNATIVAATVGTGHIGDYAIYDGVDDGDYTIPYADMSDPAIVAAEGVDPHEDDSVADFFGTSRSALGLGMGWTLGSGAIAPGVEDFFDFRGYVGAAEATMVTMGWGFTWDVFVEEIQNGRPVIINVQAHTIIAIGYNLLTGQYAVYDTWDTDMHWHDFSGDDFTIQSAILVTVS